MKPTHILFGVALLAAVNTFAEEISSENILLEVHSDVEAMKKKGATEADCKDLAKTTCKEVKSNNGITQKVIDSQSSGAECTKQGQKMVLTTVKRYQQLMTRWKVSKSTITKLSNAKVTITKQRFKTLKVGKCGFVFTSRSYLSARAKYNRAVSVERTLRGKITEAKKVVAIARKTQKNLQEKCRCAVVKRRDTIWKNVNNSAKRKKAAKALAKCKMMSCVLAGTPVTSKKCKGVLPKLRNKKLDASTEHAHSSGICHRRHRENAGKEKANKREKNGKKEEKLAKARAKKQEQASKAKARELKGKAVKREHQAKEQKTKHHEKRSKTLERSGKERNRKAAAERSGKAVVERRKKKERRWLKVDGAHWTGWANDWDGYIHYAHPQNNGFFIGGILSYHDNGKEDRRFKFRNLRVGSHQRVNRHISGYVNNWDQGFTYSCPGNRVITGLYSYHNNGKEDRRWKVECSGFKHLAVRKGVWPNWQTRFDAHFNLQCGNNPMVGISSYHDNGKEDRRWRVQCGSFALLRL